MTPSQTHWVIVALETFFCPLPNFTLPAPHTCEFRNYERTRPDQIAERIRDADVVILTILPLTAEVLSAEATPHLKSTKTCPIYLLNGFRTTHTAFERDV